MKRYLLDRIDDSDELLDEDRYPISADDLIDEFGDLIVSYPDGSETLREILGRVSPDTYRTPEEARTAILTGVGTQAVGRQRYSDRDPPVLGADEYTNRSESF
ncbi:DUF5789 family protein [Halorussus aquaticus]|uniref:DUF2795 domain-containing protein n=1 Tax=Halorussus aquaticus TaxID=2953748 RepID=A0ABD5Q834_9EURY|nr:DUF2795 domain-containing protein [Halorussus aquaticus]